MTTKCPKCHFDNPDTQRFCGECGTPLSSAEKTFVTQTETFVNPVKELTTGYTFAIRYQIIEELGKGGMGKVEKAVEARDFNVLYAYSNPFMKPFRSDPRMKALWKRLGLVD